MTPNVVGIILGITQFYVFFYYKNYYSKIDIKAKNISIDNSLSEFVHKEDVEIIIKEKEIKSKK